MRINSLPVSFKSSLSKYKEPKINIETEEKIHKYEEKDIYIKEPKFSLYNDYNILVPKYPTQANKPILHQYDSEKRPQEGQFMGDNGKVFNRHTTHYARVDINWKDLGSFFQERFKDTPKVNTYIYGCSYGEEAYTLLSLLSLRTKNPNRFLPIKAKDITPELIERNTQEQKSGVVLSLDAIHKISSGIGVSEEQMVPMLGTTKENRIKIKDKLAKQIEFECANILLDINSIDSKNPSIVMARNMWPYISANKYETVAKALYDKLTTGSVVVIGNYDNTGERDFIETKQFPKYLKKAGFKPTNKAMPLLSAKDEKPVVFVKD